MEKFTRTKPELYTTQAGQDKFPIFIYDDSWHAQAVEMIGVKNNQLTRIEDPEAKPGHVLCLTVGRGRRFRYVVSDGEVYADIHGEVIPGHRTHRRSWCRQKGPWVITTTSSKKLNQNAKAVICAAIDGALLVQFKAKRGVTT